MSFRRITTLILSPFIVLFPIASFGASSMNSLEDIKDPFWDTFYFFKKTLPRKADAKVELVDDQLLVDSVNELIAPLVYIPDEIDVANNSLEIEFYASEALKTGDFGPYSIEICEKKDLCYVLKINEIQIGESEYNIAFADMNGNEVSKSLTTRRSQPIYSVLANDYPDEKIVTNGDSLYVLIDKEYGLSSDYSPSDLVSLSDYSISGVYSYFTLRKEAAEYLQKMNNDLISLGMNISVLSAYRSYSEQAYTYNYWVSLVGIAEADRASARAGHSEHQLGTTVDLTSTEIDNKLSQNFGNTNVGIWLAENSYKYGFVMSYPPGSEHITGYKYEPWHFRYVGVGTATAIKSSGLTSSEYLRDLNGL